MTARSSLETVSSNQLTSVLAGRRTELSHYLESIGTDLETQASSPGVVEAVAAFEDAWTGLSLRQRERLQQNTAVGGGALATGTERYGEVHDRYHPWFSEFIDSRGYYDLFLMDPAGDVIYTVFKEPDFATNLTQGRWRDTGLAQAFRTAMDGNRAFVDFASYAPSNGAAASFIARPVRDREGKLLGVLAFQMPIGKINQVLQESAGLGQTGETYVVGPDDLMRSDSRFSEDSTILKREVSTATSKAALGGESGVAQTADYRGVEVMSAYAPLDVFGTRWAVLAEMDLAEINAPATNLAFSLLKICLIIIALAAAIGWFVARGISCPIVGMTTAMKQLASGKLETDVPARDRRDEVGEMSEAVQIFKDTAIETNRLRHEQEENERKAEERRRQDMLDLADKFEKRVGSIVESVSSAATELQATSQQLASAVEETGAQSTAIAAASEQASTNVQTVAAAAEELTQAIQGVSQQVGDTARLSNSVAEGGRTARKELDELNDAVAQVTEVVSQIADVAEQTNLLALNATIEAARAGDAGKGFAVVAQEVKSLAEQTHKMTEQIGAQIGAVRNSTGKAVEVMREVIDQIGQIDEATSTVAASVEQQSAATGEISRNATQAASGTQEVASNISGVQTANQQSGEASSNVKDASSELAKNAETLKKEVTAFLSEVRAA